jgi:hypothetical protein
MKADTLNAKDLFEKNVRYVIPTFQRPYVWNQDDQWEPLWLDVENAAERYLDALAASDDDAAKAEKLAGRHFLGAIVVQQELTGAAEIETRNVIDGQQRLTTMQILLDAAQEVAEAQGWEEVAEGLTDLVLNNKRYARKNADHVFKLWPTSTDRDAFRAVMKNGGDTEAFAGSQIVLAHEYFRLRIVDWVEKAPPGSERQRRIHALETALLGLLELVVIDLESADDAFVIFETLNARGTPLRPSDLVKNYLMQTVAAEGGSPDAIHAAHWVQFEREEWWRKDIRQGRLTRPRIDVFLDYWLELVTRNEVASHDVFPVFRGLVEEEDRSIVGLVAEIQRDGQTFREMDDIDPWSPEGTFLYRWRTMDVGTSTPLLLWLMGQPEEVLDRDERQACLRTLESFLVRRMVGRLTTKNYNLLFLEVLKRLVDNGAGGTHQALEQYLLEQTSDARSWPTDAEFTANLTGLPLYRLLTRGRMRMILESIEDSFRSPNSEDEFVKRGKLTIEHLLPQAWKNHWPLPSDADPVLAAVERDRILHTLGNLTLVTSRLNPGLSNNAWDAKRPALNEHTVLLMNTRLLQEYPDAWGEEQIHNRGRKLAEVAIEIWPRGTSE